MRAIFFFLPLILLAACSRKSDAPAASRGWKSEIRLEDAVSSDGCLSLERLFEGFRQLDPELPMLHVPTAIRFDSEGSVRRNFQRSVAYGQLTVTERKAGGLHSLPAAKQDACVSVTLADEGAEPKAFAVKRSARDSLAVEAEDGERYEYTWLSPRSVRVAHRYDTLDQPCGPGDKPVHVTIEQTEDWGVAAVPATVPAAGSAFSIESEFLALAAEAVGEDPASLYAGAEAERSIDLARVAAMSEKPPRPEIVSCGGADPEPPPRDGGNGGNGGNNGDDPGMEH